MNTIKLNTIGEAPIKKGAGGGGGNKYTYYDISRLSEEDKAKAMDYAYVAKEIDGESIYYDCIGLKYRNDYISGIVAIGVDLSARVSGGDGLITIAEASEGLFDNLPRVTEEEFYGITPPKNHSISGEIYVSNNECTFGYNMYTGGFNIPKGSTLVVNGNEVEKTNYNEYRYNVYEADGWYPFELKFTQAVTNLDRFGMGDSFNGGVTNLRNLDFSNFDASAVTSIGQGAFSFGGDVLPQTLDLSMCNFENVETISAFGATSYEKESSFTLKLDGYMPKLWDWSISYLEGVTATLMYKKENEQYITPYKDSLISSGWTLVPF